MKKSSILLVAFLFFNSIACNRENPPTLDAGRTTSAQSLTQSATIEKNGFQSSPKPNEIIDNKTSLTGTYELKAGSRSNEIKVLQISETELEISFLGTAEFESQMGPMANSGEFPPMKIQIKNNKAVFSPPDEPKCRITFIFKSKQLEVLQNDHDCGFPGGVLASGTYTRTSSQPPAFEDAPSANL